MFGSQNSNINGKDANQHKTLVNIYWNKLKVTKLKATNNFMLVKSGKPQINPMQVT